MTAPRPGFGTASPDGGAEGASLSTDEREELNALRAAQKDFISTSEDARHELAARRARRQQVEQRAQPSAVGDDPRLRSAAIGAAGGFTIPTIVAAAIGESPVVPSLVGATVGGVSGFAIEHQRSQQ